MKSYLVKCKHFQYSKGQYAKQARVHSADCSLLDGFINGATTVTGRATFVDYSGKDDNHNQQNVTSVTAIGAPVEALPKNRSYPPAFD